MNDDKLVLSERLIFGFIRKMKTMKFHQYQQQ